MTLSTIVLMRSNRSTAFRGHEGAKSASSPATVDECGDRDQQDPERGDETVAHRAQGAFHGSGVGCQSVGEVLEGCLEAVGNAVLGELVADQRELFEIGGDLG